MEFKTALVTGAGSGLGRAFALELAARGASVLAADLRADAANETAELARARGVKAIGISCDVRNIKDVESAVELAERELGPLDLCVNNAGVMTGGDIGVMSLDDWKFTLDVNLWGAIHGVHACTPLFKSRGRGHFLNVASIAGVISSPETGPYNVSKAAIISLSETAYAELGKWNIGATVLCPTAVRTNIFTSMRSSNPTHRALAEKNAASGGPREPDQIARIALEAARSGKLYVFPQPDAKAAWFAKRMMPSWFTALARKARNERWLEKSITSGT